MGWQVAQNGHEDAVIRSFEHDGTPVVVFGEGRYPSIVDDGGENLPCVEVAISGMARTSASGEREISYYGWRVTAAGLYVGSRRRQLGVASGRCVSSASPDAALAEALTHLDEAVIVLRSIDETYDRAYARIRDGSRYTEPFTTQDEYEAACADVGVEALADVDCYGVRHGHFSFPEYAPDYVLAMDLAWLRLRALDAQAASKGAVAEAPVVPVKQGQLWEPCEMCGREPVHMPLHICDGCWPS